MTEWEKFLERRKANLGYRSKLKSFGEPSEAEKASALAIERKHWDETRTSWKETLGRSYVPSFKMSEPYTYPINVDPWYTTHTHGKKMSAPEIKKAIDAYIETPMEIVGKYEGMDIDFLNWKEVSLLKAIFYKLIGRKVRRKNDY